MLMLHDLCNRARYSIGVGVTGFELDFWGRVRNLSDAARSQYLATVQSERAFRLALFRHVASHYVSDREADARSSLSEATVRHRHAGLRLAQSTPEHSGNRSLASQADKRPAGVEGCGEVI